MRSSKVFPRHKKAIKCLSIISIIIIAFLIIINQNLFLEKTEAINKKSDYLLYNVLNQSLNGDKKNHDYDLLNNELLTSFPNSILCKKQQNAGSFLVDPELPEGLTDMVIKHFKAMNDGDVELFKMTLSPEDGSDSLLNTDFRKA